MLKSGTSTNSYGNYKNVPLVQNPLMMVNGVPAHEEHLKSVQVLEKQTNIMSFKYLFDVVNTAQPPTSRQRSEDLHLAVLPFGEALVLAALTCGTHLWVTLVQQHAVDAL